MSSMSTITNKQVPSFVASRSDFKSNSGSAARYSYCPSTDRLPQEWVEQLRKDIDAARAADEKVYVVFSYATPIAWCAAGQWTIPAVKYSVTTSKFQGLVRMGASTYVETISVAS
jgi:hypothetical protein